MKGVFARVRAVVARLDPWRLMVTTVPLLEDALGIHAPPKGAPFDPHITFNFSKASVLTIDANLMCQDLLNGILSGYGFRKIFRCTELEGGRRTVMTHGVDLIVIDPYPYGADAYDFLRWFRTERGGLHALAPVLIVTGHTHMSLITTTLECGADYVVAKPFSTNALLERILWVAQSETRRGSIHNVDDVVSAGSGVEIG